MRYLGIDVHPKSTVWCLLDAQGEVRRAGKVPTSAAGQRPRRLWAEQVLPFGLADMWLVTPSGWTLTETSHEVRLPSPGQPPRAD